MTRRLQAIDRKDPMRQRQAMRIFLECALSAALGERLLNDPAFAECVEAVYRHMAADAELSAAMDEAAAWLLSRHGGSETSVP